MRNFFYRICLWIDALEFAVPAAIAGLILVIGPLLAAAYFIYTRHFLAAGCTGGLWLLLAFSCIRDLRRRSFGWISGAPGILWIVLTVIIWWKIESA